MIFLRSIERVVDMEQGSGFPFDIPPLNNFRKLDLKARVVFLVGENGTGKSSFLEAIGLRAKLGCATGKALDHDPALVPIHPLARSFRLNWAPQTKYGFFLRVEDFFQHTRNNRARAEPLGAVAVSHKSGEQLMRGYRAVPQFSDDETLRQSPGESFLNFVQSHCVPGGLHLIDEPEAALSPQRQLAFMSLLKSVADENAQFIIATHSPILVAYPGAQIVSFDDNAVRSVDYHELPHVTFTKNFLNDPENYLRDL